MEKQFKQIGIGEEFYFFSLKYTKTAANKAQAAFDEVITILYRFEGHEIVKAA